MRERDQSSDEEMCRAYVEALQSPKAVESPKHSQHTSDSGTEDCQNDEPSLVLSLKLDLDYRIQA